MTPYRKSIVAALVTLVSAVVAAVTGEQIDTEEATLLVLEVVTLVGVFVVPNDRPPTTAAPRHG